MPRTETVIQVFVASPGDVSAERAALEHVIRELNQTWSTSFNVRLDLLRWETHAFPAFGVDAQDVINRQIPNDYDVFIGIMWTRYGTPTGRFGSGTAEEFERALERHKADTSSVHLMMYFKDAPVSLSEIDLEQVRRVREFKQHVEAEGGLHWSFKDIEQFETVVRLHLSRYVQEWKKLEVRVQDGEGELANTSGEATIQDADVLSTSEEELGLYDLVEVVEDSFASLTQVAGRIKSATEELAEQVEESSKEITNAQASSQQVSYKVVKRVTDRVAEDMDRFVTRMKVETPIFSESYDRGLRAMGKAAGLSLDLSSDNIDTELGGLVQVVKQMHAVFTSTHQSAMSFRDIVASMPRLTAQFNRAKRDTVAVLDDFLKELETAASLTDEAQKVVQSLIKDTSQTPGLVDLRTRGIDEAHAADLRAQLGTFAEDWDSPEMDIYDNYDANSRI